MSYIRNLYHHNSNYIIMISTLYQDTNGKSYNKISSHNSRHGTNANLYAILRYVLFDIKSK